MHGMCEKVRQATRYQVFILRISDNTYKPQLLYQDYKQLSFTIQESKFTEKHEELCGKGLY